MRRVRGVARVRFTLTRACGRVHEVRARRARALAGAGERVVLEPRARRRLVIRLDSGPRCRVRVTRAPRSCAVR